MFQESLNLARQGRTTSLKKKIQSNKLAGRSVGQDELFRLQDIDISFGDFQALKNIHLKISMGEVIFLTGASGAGKTTLMRVLSGELAPSKGTLYLAPFEDKTRPALFVAKVFQDLRLMSNWTCSQNLQTAYDSQIYRSRSEFMDDLEEIAKVLGFHDRLNLKISNANGGLKQKVAMARALLTRPDILLADEPTNSLDNENAQRIFDVVSLYNLKQKMTVIWASHNNDLVKKFTGRTIHLDRGKLIYSGHACLI